MVKVALFLLLIMAAPETGSFRSPATELGQGFLAWRSIHAEARKQTPTLKLDLPSLDYFDADGQPLYHAEDSGKNAEFLRNFPKSSQSLSRISGRPTLREMCDMFTAVRSQSSLLIKKQPTVFAVTYAEWADAEAQNKAVAMFRKRAQGLGIRVLEIQLQ